MATLKSQIKKINKEIGDCLSKIDELKNERHLLIEKIRNKCDHKGSILEEITKSEYDYYYDHS
jgi:uncharacterized coiled-coil DUF342 family protein